MTDIKNKFTRIFDKLFVWQWTLGLFYGKMEDIILTKSFDPDIKWMPIEAFQRFVADPFFCEKEGKEIHIMAEEFKFEKDYGKITLLTFNEALEKVGEKELLDTHCHLSYPFSFRENNRIYVFPESGKSGKLSCYEYDPKAQKLIFLQSVVNLPLIDSTIVKYENKYWLFGTLFGGNSSRKLMIYFSDNLMGPYKEHPKNPVTDSLNGSRPAGNFINIKGNLFRPAQNSANHYGESITIYRVNILNEEEYKEEVYMQIAINRKKTANSRFRTIHTINEMQGVIVVDGAKRVFSPYCKLKYWLKRRFRP
jgi:hypothetical protein